MANLVLRSQRPKPVLTRALRRRDRLSPTERFRVWWPAIFFFVSIIVLLGALPMLGSGQGDAIFVVIWASMGTAWGFCWCAALTFDERSNFSTRAEQVKLDRLRRSRPYRDQEKTRLRELHRKYTRYSVDVEHVGGGVRLVIVAHTHRPRLCLLVPWRARKTKLGVDHRGSFANRAIGLREIDNPTAEIVTSEIADLQATAEALENKSYAEALKDHGARVVAMATSPPPAGAPLRRQVDRRTRDHLAEIEKRLATTAGSKPDEPTP